MSQQSALVVGRNLRAMMGMHGVDQVRLAQYVGMTKQGIWQIAAGRNMPRATTLSKLSEAFGVEVTDLFAKEEDAVMAAARAFPDAPIRSRRQLDAEPAE